MFTTNQYPDPVDAAVGVPQYIISQGGPVRARAMPTIECLWVDFMVINPTSIPFTITNRKLNPRYAALEIASLLGGMPVDTHQRLNARGFAKYQDAHIQRGNYGVRIRNQLRDFVHRLIEDRFSRQAVMTLYDGNRDLLDDSRDIPCTLAVQGFVRDGNFYMGTTMRSNDAYLGLPYDLMQFCALQATLAEVLGVNCGFYRHSVGSMHIYLPDLEKCEKLEAPEQVYSEEPLWNPDEMEHHHPIESLKYVVGFCQAALYGQAETPKTPFEHWLLESL